MIFPSESVLEIRRRPGLESIVKVESTREIGDKVTLEFEILEETLLGFMLPAFSQSIKKSQRILPKFYFSYYLAMGTLSDLN